MKYINTYIIQIKYPNWNSKINFCGSEGIGNFSRGVGAHEEIIRTF